MPVNRPIIQCIINYDPYWLAALTSAEDYFLIQNLKTTTAQRLVIIITMIKIRTLVCDGLLLKQSRKAQ